MPLTHIPQISPNNLPLKKTININKVPANWRLAKGLTENLSVIKPTTANLSELSMGNPKITKPESINTLRDTIKNTLLHNNKYISTGIAVYGFSASQLKSCRFIRTTKPEKSITTIANFNQSLYLNKENLNHENLSNDYIYQSLHQQLNNFIEALSDSQPKHAPEFGDNHLESCLYLWKDYLHQHGDKIDIFRYINSKKIPLDDKKELINKLIIKNTPEPIVPQELYKFIIDNDIFNCTSLSDFKRKVIELHNDGKLNSIKITRGLFELIQNHLFRNTSKVGLDFFNENLFSIIMTWNDENNTPLSLPDILQKAFKQGHRRSFNGHEHIEPITFSEIRHLARNKEKFAKKIVRMITDNTQVAFSLGLEGHWGIYDKAEFLPNVKN